MNMIQKKTLGQLSKLDFKNVDRYSIIKVPVNNSYDMFQIIDILHKNDPEGCMSDDTDVNELQFPGSALIHFGYTGCMTPSFITYEAYE
jgi:hypothetical protein